MKKSLGYVYILTNPSMPGIVKVGSTDNLGERLGSLDRTNTPLKFEPFFTVKTKKYETLEKVVHRELDVLTDTRVRPNREFFSISPEKVRDLIVNICKLISDDDLEFEDYGHETEDVVTKKGTIRLVSSPTTFEMLNIPVGTVLEPISEKYPKVVTVDNKNMVELEDGTKKTISRTIVDITGTSRNGFSCYKYGGKILSKIRLEIDKSYSPSMQK